MQTSDIELRARDLDEARKIRIVKSGDIDVEKWSKSNDIGQFVRDPVEWLLEISAEYDVKTTSKRVCMPWTKTHEGFDFRKGEVTVYAGSNGGGKSLATGQIAMSLIEQGEKVCVASFEMKPKRTLLRMLRQFGGFNFDVPLLHGENRIHSIIAEFSVWADGYLWLYDQQGSVSPRQVVAMARYCAVELGIGHIFVDSLMKCVSGEDAYNEQKQFVDELCAIARDNNIHIHLIHHIRKGGSEETKPNKMDIKGSGSITDQVDNVFIWWRNKKKEHDIQRGNPPDNTQPDAIMMCEKQRNGESERWYNLWYDKDSQQFIENANAGPTKWKNRD